MLILVHKFNLNKKKSYEKHQKQQQPFLVKQNLFGQYFKDFGGSESNLHNYCNI